MWHARRDPLTGLSRRAALGAGVMMVMAALWPRRMTARAQGVIPDTLQRRFLDWSRAATGVTDLPADTARTCLDRVLRSGLAVGDLSGLDPGAYRGTPLEKRLLAAWYTGVFRIDGSEMRSYDTTLMWQAAGIEPPPSSCGGTPDRWASAPSNI